MFSNFGSIHFADFAAQEGDYARFSGAMTEGGEVQLQRFVKEYSPGWIQPETAIEQGNAANYILSFAQDENMEVIVMGTGGRKVGFHD